MNNQLTLPDYGASQTVIPPTTLPIAGIRLPATGGGHDVTRYGALSVAVFGSTPGGDVSALLTASITGDAGDAPGNAVILNSDGVSMQVSVANGAAYDRKTGALVLSSMRETVELFSDSISGAGSTVIATVENTGNFNTVKICTSLSTVTAGDVLIFTVTDSVTGALCAISGKYSADGLFVFDADNLPRTFVVTCVHSAVDVAAVITGIFL